jgi:hypothetical protein
MLLAELFTGCTDVSVRAGVVHFWTEAAENAVYIGLVMGIGLSSQRCP